MTIRQIVAVASTAISLLLLPGAALPGEPSRPNILFMLTDDQRFDDLGCMGNSVIQTPHLDQLAADGGYIEHDPPFEQLFDLKRDPGEHRNLAGSADHAKILAEMRARWERLGQEAR